MADDDTSDIDELGSTLHGDINARLDAMDGSMLIKHLTLCEVMDAAGERALVMTHSPDMKPWETLGMVEFARQAEQAGFIEGD